MRALEWLRPSRWPSAPNHRRVLRDLADASLIAVSLAAAYVVRFESFAVDRWLSGWSTMVVPMVALRLGTARLLGVHLASWRLFGVREAERLALSVGAASLIMLMARLMWPALGVPLGVLGLEGLFTMGASWGVRTLVRALDEAESRAQIHAAAATRKRALLVGADRDGQLAAEALRASPAAALEVVGFLDDAPARTGQRIAGVPVLGRIDEAAAVARRTGAELLVLTMPSATRAQRREVVERCRDTGLALRTVPAYWELVDGAVEVAAVRSIRIEDLLGREVVGKNPAALAAALAAYRGRRILVTGAGGSIGSELCRQLAKLEPAALVLLEYSENNLFDIEAELRPQLGGRAVPALVDIRDAEAVGRIFAKHQPEVVFHAAAYKHVPMMELHPCDAVANNVGGTRTIVEAAQHHGVGRFVMVSTDKAVNPTNVMGATKRAGEMIVQSRARTGATKMCCVRFGNVLGSRGSVLHTFQKQIERGGPVTVTHPDITRYFMTIPEAVRLVLQAGAAGGQGEVFLLDMGEPVRIADMAAHMIRLAGRREDEVAIEFCGLRPGEKLHEELAHNGEDVVPSGMDGINVVAPELLDAPTILPWVARLERAARQRDVGAVRQLLALGTGYRREAAPQVELDGEGIPEIAKAS
ncbi:MAG: polysaccharide biosynthesis protein [Deltaproteobacteria bacterium]|nr:polysaccharide biosynthesis protein [Deltaproteobacteria bacterium]